MDRSRKDWDLPHFKKFSFFIFWFFIYITIASKNHNKLMKTFNFTANKSAPRFMKYYIEGWCCMVILVVLWYQKTTFKRLTFDIPVRMPSSLIQTDRNDRKVKKALACIRMRSNDHTNTKKDWYQIAQCITYKYFL